jgi:hypothetical protein
MIAVRADDHKWDRRKEQLFSSAVGEKKNISTPFKL